MENFIFKDSITYPWKEIKNTVNLCNTEINNSTIYVLFGLELSQLENYIERGL